MFDASEVMNITIGFLPAEVQKRKSKKYGERTSVGI